MVDITRTFPLNKYPTLHKFALSDAKIKFVVGPAGCVPGDTLVRTPSGWRKISTGPSTIMVYDPVTNQTRYEEAEWVKYPGEDFIDIRTSGFSSVVSSEHKVWYKTKRGRKSGVSDWIVETAEDFVNTVLSDDGKTEFGFLICDHDTGELGFNVTYFIKKDQFKFNVVRNEDGFKYCYHTSTGAFVALRQGYMAHVTGNSAKTSYMTMEILRRACLQEPDHNGIRRTRVLVGRNTYQVLKSATMKTFMEMWGGFAQFKLGSFPMMAFLRIELTDGTKVHCDVEFISFDNPDSIGKLLGYEPTIVFLDEISELPEEVIVAAARRTGRFPPPNKDTGFKGPTWHGVIGATNGPRKNHWLYDWYLGKKDDDFAKAEKGSGRKQFELFFQPPALLRTIDGDWIPNPRAENIDNLADGYGYYFDKLADEPADIQAYVEGRFADLVTGKLVFPEFQHHIHVVEHKTLNLSGGFPLYLSFDFGRTPFCLVATTFESGALVLIDEIMGEDMSIETLTLEHLLPKLRQRYPRAWIEDSWGDPAGEVKTQAVDVSPYDVLRTNGIPIRNPDPSNRLEPRIESVKQMLRKLTSQGKPMLRVSDNCPVTIASLGSDYIYEQKRGTNGVVQDKPTKSHVNWVSEAADATQYLAIGYNSMLGVRQKRKKFANLPKLNRGFL